MMQVLAYVGCNSYDWPSKVDIATVKQIKLISIGNGSFEIENHQKSLKNFMGLKSRLE